MAGTTIVIRRAMFIGGVMTTGIILTDHISGKTIIATTSIMTGNVVTENTIGNTSADNKPGPLITKYNIEGLSFFRNLIWSIPVSSAYSAPFVASRTPNLSFYHYGQDQQQHVLVTGSGNALYLHNRLSGPGKHRYEKIQRTAARRYLILVKTLH